MLLALTIFGLVMAGVTRQLIESATITLKTSRTLEYARSGRNFIAQLGADMRSAQSMTLYPAFNSRSAAVGAGDSGNYLVLHQINSSGTITRTVGYYAVANGASLVLYRHDSADGVITPGSLPAAGTQGTHRVLVGTFRVPSGASLFTNWRSSGVSLRGQYGTAPGAAAGTLNYIQCTLTKRS
jgi:hypothetical protein